jgi:hypothetical protein
MKREYMLAKRDSCPFRYKVVIRMQSILQFVNNAQKQRDIYNWLLNTLPSDAYALEEPVILSSYDRRYFFKTAEDAILFKLTWG